MEVQVDGGPWQPATMDEGEDAEFAWKLWSLEWRNPAAGEHSITSRAIDTEGHIQPAQDDPGSPVSAPIGKATARSPAASASADRLAVQMAVAAGDNYRREREAAALPWTYLGDTG